MYFLRLCARNVLRHLRRSLATVSVVAIGFIALNVFAGYTSNVFAGLRAQAVQGEGLGHLTIAKRGFFERGRISPGKFLMSGEELKRIQAIVKAEPQALLATPRLGVSGLISNGLTSTIFLAEGVVPEDARRLRGDFRIDRQGLLRGENPRAGLVATDLAAALALKPGASAVLFTSTSEGLANALDVDVEGIFNTGTAQTNDKAMLLPFGFVQQLFDTAGAERVVVMLSDINQTEAVRDRLGRRLQQAGFEIDIRNWQELSAFYTRVHAFLSMIFSFISAIVFIVVLMSVANTMSLTVVERTREIGTLRALGMKRQRLVTMFTQEGVMLALLACVLGTPLTLLLAAGINAAKLHYVPPNSSDHVLLQVDLDPQRLMLGALLLSLTAGVAALIPALRAARMTITDALGHS